MCDNNISTSRLRELIDSSRKTRENIAKELDCDTSTVTKHYNGDRKITVDYIIKYAKYFNVSSDYLLGLSNAKTKDRKIQDICRFTGLSEKSIIFLNEMKKFCDETKNNTMRYKDYLDKTKQFDVYLKLINFVIEDTYQNGSRYYSMSDIEPSNGCLLQRIYGFFNQYNSDDGAITKTCGGSTLSLTKLYEYGYLYEITEYIKKIREIYTDMYSEDFPKIENPQEFAIDDELPF